MTLIVAPKRATAVSTANQVLTIARKDPSLPQSLGFLTPQEIAVSRRVNKAFNKASTESPFLRSMVNKAKQSVLQNYLRGPAREQFFSQPCLSWCGLRNPVLSRDRLALLEKYLMENGNRKSSKIGDQLGIRFYEIAPAYTFSKFKPTDIIKMIPSKEISGLYKYMWILIGHPNKYRAGEKAFHDEDGMKSTPEQKAQAIRLFLIDEAVRYAMKQKKNRKDQKASQVGSREPKN